MDWFTITLQPNGQIIGLITDPEEVASILHDEGLDYEELRQLKRLNRGCGMSMRDWARADQGRLLELGGGCCAWVSDSITTFSPNLACEDGFFIMPEWAGRDPEDWYSAWHVWVRFKDSNALLDATADQFFLSTGRDVIIIPPDSIGMVHYQSAEPPVRNKRLGVGLPRGIYRQTAEQAEIYPQSRVFVIITEEDQATWKNPFADALYMNLCPFWIEQGIATLSVILGPEDELPRNTVGCLIHGESAETPAGDFPSIRYNVSPGFVSDDNVIIEDPIAGGNMWDPRHYRLTQPVLPILEEFVAKLFYSEG